MTALRVIPPSSAAICEADSPSDHSFFSISTRSSVQLMPLIPSELRDGSLQTESIHESGQPSSRPDATPTTNLPSDSPPHEMSYLVIETLQYGESQTQESEALASTSYTYGVSSIHTFRKRRVLRAAFAAVCALP